jgi:hypothetical protein
MVGRVLKIAIVVVAVYALMHNPGDAARNVRTAGKAAFQLVGTLADRTAAFFEALMR